jgi:hypothetical protein
VSVPRPWAPRRPIWQLVLALLAWLTAAVSLVGLLIDPDDRGFRLLMTVLWTGIGVVWAWQWRRAVKKDERGGDQPGCTEDEREAE